MVKLENAIVTAYVVISYIALITLCFMVGHVLGLLMPQIYAVLIQIGVNFILAFRCTRKFHEWMEFKMGCCISQDALEKIVLIDMGMAFK